MTVVRVAHLNQPLIARIVNFFVLSNGARPHHENEVWVDPVSKKYVRS